MFSGRLVSRRDAEEQRFVEWAGHDMGVGQAWRYDELGLQSDVGQIRDYYHGGHGTDDEGH